MKVLCLAVGLTVGQTWLFQACFSITQFVMELKGFQVFTLKVCMAPAIGILILSLVLYQQLFWSLNFLGNFSSESCSVPSSVLEIILDSLFCNKLIISSYHSLSTVIDYRTTFSNSTVSAFLRL